MERLGEVRLDDLGDVADAATERWVIEKIDDGATRIGDRDSNPTPPNGGQPEQPLL